MNCAQFKDTVSHMCLASTVAASWFLTEDVAVSSALMTNVFVIEFTEFSENI